MADEQKTTLLVDRYRDAARRDVPEYAYKGLGIHALPGLHDFVGQKAVEFFAPGARLLDMAAGTGAMCLRMQDLGFTVSATDYVAENFKLPGVPFIQADLNQSFSQAYPQRFEAIISAEIIEHLENPRHFARECFKLLEPGGRMILTTPNVDSPYSKAAFIRGGTFLWFSEADYKGHGHITPITQWQLKKSFGEAGFKFLWTGSYGEGASLLKGSHRLQLLAKLFAAISTEDPSLSREIFVMVIEKPAG